MKKAIFYIIIIIFFFSTNIFSQKYDFVYPIGGKNSASNKLYGGTNIDFNESPPKIYAVKRNIQFDLSQSFMCDSLGKLKYYTNGCQIENFNDHMMSNGIHLNPGGAYDEQCADSEGNGSYWVTQSIANIPLGNNQYRMFHMGAEFYSKVPDYITEKFYYTDIDMNANNGEGKVLKKNVLIRHDTFSHAGLTLVKHANGQDWWYLGLRRQTNTFLKFLLKKDTILGPFRQSIGDSMSAYGYGWACFSPNGKKYIRCSELDYIRIYDFDRATGTLSKPLSITYPLEGNTDMLSVCVSPNNRYLYVSHFWELYQFDLDAADIAASKTLIAKCDKFVAPGDILSSNFGSMWIGPDCRIYMGSNNGVRSLHVIHHPNKKGKACNFEDHAIILPTKSYLVGPSIPNYRLDIAPTCDSTIAFPQVIVPTDNVLETWLPSVVYPNPSSGDIQLDIDLQHIPKATWKLFNTVGSLIDSKEITHYETSYSFDYNHLPDGVYFYTIMSEQRWIKKGKLVIQH